MRKKGINVNFILGGVIVYSVIFIFYFLIYRDVKTASLPVILAFIDGVTFLFNIMAESRRSLPIFRGGKFSGRGASYYTYVLLFIGIPWLMYLLPFIFGFDIPYYFAMIHVLKHLLVFIYIFVFIRYYAEDIINVHLHTPQIVLIGFIALIILGGLLLYEPVALTKNITFVDALFTSTSAVCVTGLIVKDTPVDFTPAGYTMIMLLIQLGGLGIMMLYASLVLLLSGNFPTQGFLVTKSALDVESKYQTFPGMIRKILAFTLVVELIGALILAGRFLALGMAVKKALYFGLFHSVSSFCNAGFALYSDNLVSFRGDWVVNIMVMSLITLGGIGFLVGTDIFSHLYRKVFKPARYSRLAPQTKIVLVVYLVLNVVGGLLFFLFEQGNVLKNEPGSVKFLSPLFQCVSARTAGFNSLDIGALRSVTLLLLDVLMIIGASAGSTGGGVKVTTFAIIVVTCIAYIQGKSGVYIYRNTISETLVKKAFTLFFVYLCIAVIFVACLLVTEQIEPEKIVFEVFSAMGTVGLSTGITPGLKDSSKILLIIAMFIGRVGPLTVFTSLTISQGVQRVGYPNTDIMIG